jgi:hypothetical protein
MSDVSGQRLDGPGAPARWRQLGRRLAAPEMSLKEPGLSAFRRRAGPRMTIRQSLAARFALAGARGTGPGMTIDWRTDIIEPMRRAAVRLFRPDVRIVTGGIAFYALFSIFSLIYLTLTLLTVFLPPQLSVQLATPISNFFSQNVEALSTADVDVIRNMMPVGLSLRAFGALILVLITATSGAKAAITGIRMIAGTAGRTGLRAFRACRCC